MLTFSASAQYTFNEIEIWPGSFPGNPRYFEEVNGTLYFQAYNNYNYELWKTNGTQLGTSMVTDLNGTGSSSPQSLKNFNGELFFAATGAGVGNELWKSDGTAAGTVLLKDIWPGSSNGMESSTTTYNGDRETFIEFNNELFFFGNTGNGVDLWKTDGTAAGTVSVKNFTQGPVYGNAQYSFNSERDKVGVIFNNELYFLVRKGYPIPSMYQGELWKTDGTTAGTVLIRDSLHGTATGLTVANNRIYFSNDQFVAGRELWSSDGTDAGTGLAADVMTGSGDSNPTYLTPFNGKLYFTANGPNGRELYETDGVSTSMVLDIFPGMGSTSPNSALGLARFFEYNGLLYFLAEDATSGGSQELWQTDGTAVGTVKTLTLADVGGYIEFLNPTIYDNKIFFRTSGQLWVTDGTPANTQQLTDNGDPNLPISQVSHLAIYQQNLWFAGANTNNGVEAWYIGNQPPTTVDVSTCESYTVPSGDETYTASGMYTDTLLNAQGGDSILIINLIIYQATTSNITASTCDEYISPSGNYTWTTSGTYTDTLINSVGCDSIITINLSVLASSNSLSETACFHYVSPSGNYTWSSSGIYMDTIPNASGCDSVITIDLTVTTVDNGIVDNQGVLEATANNASYRWLDCANNYAVIPGETNQTFSPQLTGTYAVEITEGNCVDTSDCLTVTAGGIDFIEADVIQVYPNPTNDRVMIVLKELYPNSQVSIRNVSGEIIYESAVQSVLTDITLPQAAGVYFLSYSSDFGEYHQRVVRL